MQIQVYRILMVSPRSTSELCFANTGGVVYSNGESSLIRIANELGVESDAMLHIKGEHVEKLGNNRGKAKHHIGRRGFIWKEVGGTE